MGSLVFFMFLVHMGLALYLWHESFTYLYSTFFGLGDFPSCLLAFCLRLLMLGFYKGDYLPRYCWSGWCMLQSDGACRGTGRYLTSVV